MAMKEEKEDVKPSICTEPQKSSNELISELFEALHSEPPLLIKKEKKSSKKHHHKKKHKHHHHHHHKSKTKPEKLFKFFVKSEKSTTNEQTTIRIEGTDLSIPIVDEHKQDKGHKEYSKSRKSLTPTSVKKSVSKSQSEKSTDSNRKRSQRHEHSPDFYTTYYDYKKMRKEDRSPSLERKRRPRSQERIDKKKLLEIARRNALKMMESGNLPASLQLSSRNQEKVLTALKAGGKTVAELTDFCKNLTVKPTDDSCQTEDEENDGATEDAPFHHPFQIRERPTTITMNIKNSVPLPIKTAHERTSELRLQFPVSSGQMHRENEWVPVKQKKPEPEPKNLSAGELELDLGSIISERLTAIRKLQENPYDVQALVKMNTTNNGMQAWAKSKQLPGQFLGTTGAQILTPAELNSGYQTWAKKDQLQNSAPVTGGMGMHLLQKMGWRPGEGLGKEKSGTLEPLLLEVKLDKKGLVACEEQDRKRLLNTTNNNNNNTVVTNKKPAAVIPQHKHPVSLLGEYASKNKLVPPAYHLSFECGPDHRKNFLFKVIMNGVEYQPTTASASKKEAKATAANFCLQQLGLL